MAEELKILIQQRATLKAQLTRFKTYLDKCQEPPSDQITEQLKERITRAADTFQHFEEVQLQIEAQKEDAGHENERASFEDAYFDSIARARQIIATREISTVPIVNAIGPIRDTSASIRLPTINLPTFDGKYDAWLYFHDNFKSIIHDNANITAIQKLHYLRSCLVDEAAQVIHSLDSSSENYRVAWDLLTERYDNRRIIIQSHVRALFELQTLQKESGNQLRLLVDTALKHIRALKTLDQPTDSWDTLLIHLITSKLDRITHKEWERSLDGTEVPSLEGLWKFLKNRCHILETMSQDTSHIQYRPNNRNHNARASNKAQQSYVTTRDNPECPFCKKLHIIFSCEQFLKLDHNARSAAIKAKGLCYNCLRQNHLVSTCKSSACRKCNRKHHTLLHADHEKAVQERDNSNTVQPGPSKSLQAIVSSQVLLSTAIVHVLDHEGKTFECKILLDSGSQSNFITERLAGCLKLTKREIDIPVSGFNQSLTRIKHSIVTTLKSRDGRFSANLSFLVVPKITECLPTHAINKHEINVPKNIKLADPEFCKSSEIDALIGAEIFFQLLCVGQIKLNNNSIILQKTQLGWIVSGK